MATTAKIRKAAVIGVVAVTVLLGFALLASQTQHNQCCHCGVQEYERSFMGFVVESWCEREYDEYDTYRQWRERIGGADCLHLFLPVSEYGPARSLEELRERTQNAESRHQGGDGK